MSGHSKWATIKRKKGKQDEIKGRIYTKLLYWDPEVYNLPLFLNLSFGNFGKENKSLYLCSTTCWLYALKNII